MKIEELLNSPLMLKEWLLSFEDVNTIIGVSGNPYRCPIKNYIFDTLKPINCSIGINHIFIDKEDGTYDTYILSEYSWLDFLINKIDSLDKEVDYPVTVKQVLDLLN